MPLHILLILVIGGIAGIALALHLLGLSRSQPLTDDTARSGWTRNFPEDRVNSVTLSANRRAALVETDKGPGLIWQFGADTVARRAENLQATRTDTGLDLELADFTAPRLRLVLNPDESARWATRLGAST